MITFLKNEDEKRKEIVSFCNSNCMIEAGAGAGKTTIIISRIINQLKSGIIRPEELVVITFTKAAAGELRDRLSSKLKEENEKELKDEEKKNIENAIVNQSLIQVSTIHSFCFRLLKERALDAHLPLDIEMIDEIENNKRKDAFFKWWINNKEKNKIEAYSKEFYIGEFFAFLYSAFFEIADLPYDMVFKYRKDLIIKSVKRDYINLMKDQIRRLKEKIKNVLDENGKDSTDINSKVYANISKLFLSLDTNNDYEIIKKYKDVSSEKFLSKACEDSIKIIKTDKELNSELYSFLEGEENILQSLELYQNALIIDIAVMMRNDYIKFLSNDENRKYLSNDALLQLSLKLVREKEALKYFKSKFKYIYVDEFQDTDTVQRDLVYSLVREMDSNLFSDCSFFLVGDPKQSIYAFRGADLEVYKETRRELEDKAVQNVYVYDLKRNHRSSSKIIDWVNREFKNADYGLGEAYLEMDSFRVYDEKKNVLNGVYTLHFPNERNKDLDLKKDDLIELESSFLPFFIKTLMKEYKINDLKDGKVTTRDIRYSDFLILSKKKDVLEKYAKKLKDESIPISLYGALNLKEDYVALRYKALLHFLAYKKDEMAKYGAMEVLMNSYVSKENIEKAKTKLDSFLEVFNGKEDFDIIKVLSKKLEYFAPDLLDSSALIYIESHINQIVEYLLSKGNLSLKEYDECLSDYMESKVDKELSFIYDSDSVRVMNLHKSKGLEGKIVIVLARVGEMADGNTSYRNKYEYYPSITDASSISRVYYPSYIPKIDPVLKDKPEYDRDSEKRRLEYVEATRAGNALIFFDSLATKGSSRFNKFNFEGCIDLTYENSSINKLYKDIMIEGNIKENINENLKIVEYKNEEKIKIEEGEYYLNKSPSSFEEEDSISSSEKRPSGKTFGTILHRVFELTVNDIRKGKAIDKDLLINSAILESLDDLNKEGCNINFYIKYLKEKLDDFLESKLLEKVKNAKEVYTEYKFNFLVPAFSLSYLNLDFESPYIYLNGKVDLVIVDDDIEIYDYKTDKKGTLSMDEFLSHLESVYSLQQKLYQYALAKCFKKDIEKIKYAFYHLY